MTETLHRILMFSGATVTGIAGLFVAAHLGSTEILAWVIVAGSGATLTGNQIRVWWPATKGEANTSTETTTTTTTTPPVAP